MRAAVVGAGPSGFYAAAMLLKAGFEVDLYDVLPTPFGLVRAGVAPDHPKIKAVTRVYEKTAKHAGFRFFGGVELGAHVTRAGPAGPLPRGASTRSARATTTGSGSRARTARLARGHGVRRPGTTATRDYADHEFDLTRPARGRHRQRQRRDRRRPDARARPRRAARRPTPPTTRSTPLARSQRRRRSSCSAAAARRRPRSRTPELRELGELTRADIVVDPADLELDEHARSGWTTRPTRPPATSRSCASTPPARRKAATRTASSCASCARRSRSSARASDGPVTGVAVVVNETGSRTACARSPTGEEEVIACGLVLRSIGYRGAPLAGIPFDERRGLIRNLGGRVSTSGRRAAARRVRRRLDQARPVRRHRHQQEGRRRHRRPDPRGPRRRRRSTRRPTATPDAIAAWLRRARAGRGHLGGLGGDRRARDRARRAARPPARQARRRRRAARPGPHPLSARGLPPLTHA